MPRVRAPRQRQHPVEVRAHHLVLARRRRQHAQPLDLALRLGQRLLGQRGLLDARQQLAHVLLVGVGLAQLALDRAQLLPQEELALVLVDLDLGLLLDVVEHARPRHLTLQPREHEAQPLSDVQALQHLVAIRDPEAEVGGREVGEAPWIGHVHAQDRGHVARDLLGHVGQRLGGRDHPRDQLAALGGLHRRLARVAHDRHGVGLGLLHVLDHDPLHALQRDLHRVPRQVDALVHARGHPDAIHHGGGVEGILGLARGDDERHGQSRFGIVVEQRDVFGGPHLHRDRAVREDDRRAQRHERHRARQQRCEQIFLPRDFRHSPRWAR